jgi:hypothetical protein
MAARARSFSRLASTQAPAHHAIPGGIGTGFHDPLQILLLLSRQHRDQARRLLSLAAVLDGQNRKVAAEIGAMDRQSLRDWVHRFNAKGPEGLVNGKAPGPVPNLSSITSLEKRIPPSLAVAGRVAQTACALCQPRIVSSFNKNAAATS